MEIAPDGSQIKPLARNDQASQCLCTLPADAVSRPVRHRSVTEMWYVISGAGTLSLGSCEEPLPLTPGTHLTIKPGDAFQFRATTDLQVLITTMPPWPGDEEAEPLGTGRWEPTC